MLRTEPGGGRRGEQHGWKTAACLCSPVLPIKVQSCPLHPPSCPMSLCLPHSQCQPLPPLPLRGVVPISGWVCSRFPQLLERSLDALSCSGDSSSLLLSQPSFWKAVSARAVFSSSILIRAVLSGLDVIPSTPQKCTLKVPS